MRGRNVVDGTAEDAEVGEGGVEGGVGSIMFDLAVADHAGEGVEHARAAEAHQPNEAYLD